MFYLNTILWVLFCYKTDWQVHVRKLNGEISYTEEIIEGAHGKLDERR